MKQVFENNTPVTIGAGAPSDVRSPIEVSGLSGNVTHLAVTIDVDHTFTSDLEISLEGPGGERVLLVGQEGGSGNHFRRTTFDDRSSSSITTASPPFRGSFQPEESLSAFLEKGANGTWNLLVADRAFLDGGSLNRWSLDLTVEEEVTSDFNIEVRFLGGLSSSQQDVFQAAAERWSEIIVGDLPPVSTDIGVVDDVVIDAKGSFIDGVSGILGQAGPTSIRSTSLLTARGKMEFDSADLARMERDGALLNVIVHEMGHVLGLGTLWGRMGVLVGAGTSDPVFTGQNAMREFSALAGEEVPTTVPVANTGGAGTRDGHWRESVFGNELMTGFLDGGTNPVSRMTIAALQDMGYEVNLNAADPFTLPSAGRLARMGVGAEICRCCQIASPSPVEIEMV